MFLESAGAQNSLFQANLAPGCWKSLPKSEISIFDTMCGEWYTFPFAWPKYIYVAVRNRCQKFKITQVEILDVTCGCTLLQSPVRDDPYVGTFYVPWVWRKDFRSHLVVFRCVSKVCWTDVCLSKPLNRLPASHNLLFRWSLVTVVLEASIADLSMFCMLRCRRCAAPLYSCITLLTATQRRTTRLPNMTAWMMIRASSSS